MIVRILVLMMLASFLTPISKAADAETAVAKPDRPPGIYQKELENYELFVGKRNRQPLQMEPRPILNWVGEFPKRGSVFVWTHQGRPMVVGQCFSFKTGDPRRADRLVFKHTFHSLSQDPVTCEAEGDVVWNPTSPGIDLTKGSFAGTPSGRKATRLAQMRAIGRKFKFRVEGYTKGQLRFLPQPLYRYESEKQDVIDGGIFSFSFGSDPEALLIVEAVEGDEGPEWQFGLARFNLQESFAEFGGKRIWHVGSISHFRGATLAGMKASQTRQREEYVSFYSEHTEPLPNPE